MVARFYDALHHPDKESVLTCRTDVIDGYTHPFFKASRTVEELVAARDAIAEWQRIGYGFLGRSPDFMAALLGMLGPNAELYAPYQENARRWYQRAQLQLPYVNHALANPPVDRRLPPDEVDDLYIHVVKETDAGLIVAGAKNITTNAALTHYSFVGSDGGTFVKDKAMAILFLVSMHAPGVKVICRPSYEMTAGVMGSPFDYPLSSRFDENDAIFILDNVLIPWENVLVYGETNKYNNHMHDAGLYHRMGLQACTRLAVKLDFITGLLLKAVEATGVDQFRGVQVNLGEVVTWRHLFWSLSDAMCHSVTTLNGAVIPKLEHMMSYRMLMTMAYPRIKEIVHQLVASGLIYQPSSARDFKAPELRPYLDKYVRSSAGSAVERIKLMKTLWDALGSEFGGRHELYERNNFGNHEAVRLHALFHGMTSGTIEQMKGLAEQCLAEVDLDGWTAPDLINPDDINFFAASTRHRTSPFIMHNGHRYTAPWGYEDEKNQNPVNGAETIGDQYQQDEEWLEGAL
jgi:4-hydroxyphenylacetate 3-monooxygenase